MEQSGKIFIENLQHAKHRRNFFLRARPYRGELPTVAEPVNPVYPTLCHLCPIFYHGAVIMGCLRPRTRVSPLPGQPCQDGDHVWRGFLLQGCPATRPRKRSHFRARCSGLAAGDPPVPSGVLETNRKWKEHTSRDRCASRRHLLSKPRSRDAVSVPEGLPSSVVLAQEENSGLATARQHWHQPSFQNRVWDGPQGGVPQLARPLHRRAQVHHH
ncbi:uncharacterized protein LOC144036101 [Vanacampus margaritifer]